MPALTDLQDRILGLFFDRRNEFFLTGGAALAGFYLHHRETHGRIIIDSAQEILANKLCALLSRTEVRDLVDVARLAEAGNDPIAALDFAFRKDAGMSAGQLAWVLSSFPIPTDPSLLYGMSQKDLLDFRENLINRLTAAAFPSAPQ
jgi:hypothetical protein